MLLSKLTFLALQISVSKSERRLAPDDKSSANECKSWLSVGNGPPPVMVFSRVYRQQTSGWYCYMTANMLSLFLVEVKAAASVLCHGMTGFSFLQNNCSDYENDF